MVVVQNIQKQEKKLENKNIKYVLLFLLSLVHKKKSKPNLYLLAQIYKRLCNAMTYLVFNLRVMHILFHNKCFFL